MFELPNFDVILDMNFLKKYDEKMEYKLKKVWSSLDEGDEFIFKEGQLLCMMNNSMKVRKMLSKVYMDYLVDIVSKTDESISNLSKTSLVFEYRDVLLDNLLGLALEREAEFNIKLTLGITSIPKFPYKITLVELQELKKQL